MPPAGLGGADVAADVRTGAPVGAGHQGAHGAARPAGRHAALVHREGHRHPAVQGRHLAERGGDRDDRGLGRRRRAVRRPRRPAAAARLRQRGRVDDRRTRSGPGVAGDRRPGRGARQVDVAGHDRDRIDRGPLRGGGRGARVQRRAEGGRQQHGGRAFRLPSHDVRLGGARCGRQRGGHPLADPRSRPQRRHLPAGSGADSAGRLGPAPAQRAHPRERARYARAPEVRVQAAPRGLRADPAVRAQHGGQRRRHRHEADAGRPGAACLHGTGGAYEAAGVRAAPARPRGRACAWRRSGATTSRR